MSTKPGEVQDTDKAIYALLVSDSLDGYDPATPDTLWQSEPLRSMIDARLDDVESALLLRSGAPHEVLLLLLIHGVGGGMALGFNRPKPPAKSAFLTFATHDFETLGLRDGGTHLLLRQYAHAHERARDRFTVLSPGSLDEYALYRKHRSYYLSDDAPPTFLTIAPGMGGDLKREVARRRDFHGAPYWRFGIVKEVTALHDSREIPLYIPLEDLGTRLELLVEGLPCPMWIIGPDSAEVTGRLYSQYAHLANAIAY